MLINKVSEFSDFKKNLTSPLVSSYKNVQRDDIVQHVLLTFYEAPILTDYTL